MSEHNNPFLSRPLSLPRHYGVAKKLGFALLACLLVGCAHRPKEATHAPVPTLSRTIVLSGVRGSRPNVGVPGRIDHMAYDPASKRLFIAALENGSLEVVDTETGQRIRSIGALKQPQGVAIIPTLSCAAVACGGDGALHIYDTRSLEEINRIEIGADADNVRYDSKTDTLLVSYGDNKSGAIAILNVHTWAKLGEIPFQSRPESFQLDLINNRVFANLPEGVRATKPGQVAIFNRDGTPTTFIQLKDTARNFPMTFDAANQRLFIVSRIPARLIAIDTRSGAVVSEAPCTDDSDDVGYDPQTGLVFVVGGGFRPDLQETGTASPCSPPGETGAIDLFSVNPEGRLTWIATYPTAPHARTGLFVPSRRSIYIAVPQQKESDPEIREYKLE